MRKNDPYVLKLDHDVATKARDAVAALAARLLRPFQEPYPRQKAFAFSFDSSDIAVGAPGLIECAGKYHFTLDFSQTTLGLAKGFAPHDLLRVLFHKDVSEEVVESLVMAMVYRADAETNGKNWLNEGLVDAEVARFRALVDKSLRTLGML